MKQARVFNVFSLIFNLLILGAVVYASAFILGAKFVDCLYFYTVLSNIFVVIQAVLTVEPLYHTFVNRLNDYYRTVEVGLGVHVPYNPINESTKEITFTKLDDLFGRYALRRGPLV